MEHTLTNTVKALASIVSIGLRIHVIVLPNAGNFLTETLAASQDALSSMELLRHRFIKDYDETFYTGSTK